MNPPRRLLSSRPITLATVLVLVLLCAAAGTASASSRGFRLTNHSDHALKLLAVQHIVPPCPGCIPLAYEMEFEGRPEEGAALKAGATHDWELEYGFGLTQGPHYAAELVYRIDGGNLGTENVVVWKIYTYTYSNESTCQLFGGDKALLAKFECKAEGLTLDFLNAGKAKDTEAAAQPQTVADFHRLPKAERRAFALHFMTTQPVDPCTGGKTPLGGEAAQDALGDVVATVKPRLTDSEGRPITGDAPVGLGIRAVLEKAGC
ncbi:MAG: hypothetical protein JWO14_539 [Solirubrobacterales bacterium]|nr:hypothetical protein [Solirubrobacterales bacterium]